MQIHLKTLGCRLNEAELESWAKGFQARGHSLTTSPEKADLLVVNTCAVTQEAVKKSKQIIRRAHRNNPKAKLVVSGCYASLDEKIQPTLPAIDLLVGNREKDQLVDKTLDELAFETMPSLASQPGETSLFALGRHRAFIKVQDGCRYRCTFCIVTVVRGEERSRTPKQIIDEINQYHQQGINEVVLTGVHIGGYGSDINLDLTGLIKLILEETHVPRIRIGSLEPWDLSPDFFELFSNRRLMPHMHLPLQSGSDVVLRKMARRCKTADFTTLVEQARSMIKDVNLTTDIIVGFPGETKQEWKNSFDYIKHIGFSHIHIFSYSPRGGTKAAALPDQIDPAIKKERSRALHELTRMMRENYLAEQIGKTFNVLWEKPDDNQRWTGYCDNFTRVALDQAIESDIENEITRVKIVGVSTDKHHCLVELA